MIKNPLRKRRHKTTGLRRDGRRTRLRVVEHLESRCLPAIVFITVNPISDAPVADNQPLITDEDRAEPITVSSSDSNSTSLTFTVVMGPTHGTLSAMSDTMTCTIVPNDTDTPGSTCTASVTYTPDPNYNGPDGFTYKVNDGSADSDSATVTITVNAVNDAPGFTKGQDQIVTDDAGPQVIPGWATNFDAGPPDESGQALAFHVTNNRNELFSVQPAIAPDGTLAFTPKTYGRATVWVQLQDDGGTAAGGEDISSVQPFLITVAKTIDGDPKTQRSNAFTFPDADGNLSTVQIAGPGTAGIVLNGGATNNADIELLMLQGTDPLRTKVSVKVQSASGTDNKTFVGSLRGTGLKSFEAPNSDLGTNGIELTGPQGTLKLHDILDGSHISLGGRATDHLKLTANQVGDVDLTLDGIVDQVVVNSWAGGRLHAGMFGTVQAKQGSFGADLIATGRDAKGVSINSVTAKGAFNGSIMSPGALTSLSVQNGSLTGRITAGRVGKITVQGGDAHLDLTTTLAAAALGRSAALDLLKITGGNWLGGTIDLAAGTRAQSISVGGTRNVGGRVLGPLAIDELLDSFSAGSVADGAELEFGAVRNFSLNGDLGETVGNGGELRFTGSVGALKAGKVRTAVTVGGSLESAMVDQVLADFTIGGNVGSLTLGGLSGHLTIEGNVKSLGVNAFLGTLPTDGAGSLTVRGTANLKAKGQPFRFANSTLFTTNADAYQLEQLRRYDQVGSSWMYGTQFQASANIGPERVSHRGTGTLVLDAVGDQQGDGGYCVRATTRDADSVQVGQTVACWRTDARGTHATELALNNELFSVSATLDSPLVAPAQLRLGQVNSSSAPFTASARGEVEDGTIECDVRGRATVTSKLVRLEFVTVPAGSFLAARVEVSVSLQGRAECDFSGEEDEETFTGSFADMESQTFWAAPGVGALKANTTASLSLRVNRLGSALSRVSTNQELTNFNT